MTLRLFGMIAIALLVALGTEASAQQPTNPEGLCKAGCDPVGCTPLGEIVYKDAPENLAEWGSCDVCCIDAQAVAMPPDAALVNGEAALIAKNVCTAATIVHVNDVRDCNAAINAAFGGVKLDVCILGHGAPGVVSMGAGAAANNGMGEQPVGGSPGGRDDLDSVSKPFFVNGDAATPGAKNKIKELHIFACSTGADWPFIDWLARDLVTHVKAPDKVLCAGTNAAANEECFWLEQGGTFHGAWVPAVSEWGMIVMALLAMTAGTIVFSRWRRPVAA